MGKPASVIYCGGKKTLGSATVLDAYAEHEVLGLIPGQGCHLLVGMESENAPCVLTAKLFKPVIICGA